MKLSRPTFKYFLAVSLTLLTLGFSNNLLAAELADLKTAGVVGERADGYLGLVVAEVSPEAKALVDDINVKRKAQYERIARENGLDLAKVEALAGQKTLEKTRTGGWVYQGSWAQK